MADAKKRCRVCGAEYKACKSSRKATGVFEFQEVACSEECGQVYLNRILSKRGLVADVAPLGEDGSSSDVEELCVEDEEASARFWN